MDGLISDVNVVKAENLKMSVGRNLILAHFLPNICALQTLVNANVERKVTSTVVMKKIRQLFESGRSIDRSDYSVKISKLARSVQRLSELVGSKILELQTMSGLVDEVCRLWKELYKLKKKRDRLKAEIKVVLWLGTKISWLKTTTGSIVCSLQNVEDREIETDRDLKMPQKTIAVLDFREKTLTENVLSLTVELLNVWSAPTFVPTWMR